METVHFVAKNTALCGAYDARWCTILREAVTCARCRERLATRDRGREAELELHTMTPVP
jgi:hypothetical protein